MRTDAHRPSVIKPEEYAFVAFDHVKIESFGDCEYALAERQRIQDHMTQTGGTYSGHEHGGNCHICGASAMYTALFYHAKTNTYIRTGQDCADKLDMATEDWNMFRKSMHAAIEARAGKQKAVALLAEAGLSECWNIFLKWSTEPATTWNKESKDLSTVGSVIQTVIRTGRLSEAQAKFLRILLDRIANRETVEAERAKEREAAMDCPTGRVQITGTVIKVSVNEEGPYGPSTKVVVKDDRGFLVYGSRPTITNGVDPVYNNTIYICVERGDRLTFSANVTVSDRDAKFGFFKRPTKAKALEIKERQ